MTTNYHGTNTLDEAGIKEDDTLYKQTENEQKSMNGENNLQQKYGHRDDDDLPLMDGQSSQRENQEHQEQFRQIGQSRETQGSQNRDLNQTGQANQERASQNGQRDLRGEGQHLSGYNIAKSDGQDFQTQEDLERNNGDPHPEKQVDEFYQRYGREDPLDKQL
ncbi:hypothetical protein J7E81_21890 [Bacillus sp. ISL-18]|uniref:hypothetical protein n=1 Tax=Bacillus sp. ISL-18 TaxID=2819118 RepID=UPI001BE9270A|nr:hypothetical protein [Bacillus sp. ISL-18]MBT2657857.1 hypothetical protein [Bacillus sp. ISL-18]